MNFGYLGACECSILTCRVNTPLGAEVERWHHWAFPANSGKKVQSGQDDLQKVSMCCCLFTPFVLITGSNADSDACLLPMTAYATSSFVNWSVFNHPLCKQHACIHTGYMCFRYRFFEPWCTFACHAPSGGKVCLSIPTGHVWEANNPPYNRHLSSLCFLLSIG